MTDEKAIEVAENEVKEVDNEEAENIEDDEDR